MPHTLKAVPVDVQNTIVHESSKADSVCSDPNMMGPRRRRRMAAATARTVDANSATVKKAEKKPAAVGVKMEDVIQTDLDDMCASVMVTEHMPTLTQSIKMMAFMKVTALLKDSVGGVATYLQAIAAFVHTGPVVVPVRCLFMSMYVNFMFVFAQYAVGHDAEESKRVALLMDRIAKDASVSYRGDAGTLNQTAYQRRVARIDDPRNWIGTMHRVIPLNVYLHKLFELTKCPSYEDKCHLCELPGRGRGQRDITWGHQCLHWKQSHGSFFVAVQCYMFDKLIRETPFTLKCYEEHCDVIRKSVKTNQSRMYKFLANDQHPPVLDDPGLKIIGSFGLDANATVDYDVATGQLCALMAETVRQDAACVPKLLGEEDVIRNPAGDAAMDGCATDTLMEVLNCQEMSAADLAEDLLDIRLDLFDATPVVFDVLQPAGDQSSPVPQQDPRLIEVQVAEQPGHQPQPAHVELQQDPGFVQELVTDHRDEEERRPRPDTQQEPTSLEQQSHTDASASRGTSKRPPQEHEHSKPQHSSKSRLQSKRKATPLTPPVQVKQKKKRIPSGEKAQTKQTKEKVVVGGDMKKNTKVSDSVPEVVQKTPKRRKVSAVKDKRTTTKQYDSVPEMLNTLRAALIEGVGLQKVAAPPVPAVHKKYANCTTAFHDACGKAQMLVMNALVAVFQHISGVCHDAVQGASQHTASSQSTMLLPGRPSMSLLDFQGAFPDNIDSGDEDDGKCMKTMVQKALEKNCALIKKARRGPAPKMVDMNEVTTDKCKAYFKGSKLSQFQCRETLLSLVGAAAVLELENPLSEGLADLPAPLRTKAQYYAYKLLLTRLNQCDRKKMFSGTAVRKWLDTLTQIKCLLNQSNGQRDNLLRLSTSVIRAHMWNSAAFVEGQAGRRAPAWHDDSRLCECISVSLGNFVDYVLASSMRKAMFRRKASDTAVSSIVDVLGVTGIAPIDGEVAPQLLQNFLSTGKIERRRIMYIMNVLGVDMDTLGSPSDVLYACISVALRHGTDHKTDQPAFPFMSFVSMLLNPPTFPTHRLAGNILTSFAYRGLLEVLHLLYAKEGVEQTRDVEDVVRDAHASADMNVVPIAWRSFQDPVWHLKFPTTVDAADPMSESSDSESDTQADGNDADDGNGSGSGSGSSSDSDAGTDTRRDDSDSDSE